MQGVAQKNGLKNSPAAQRVAKAAQAGPRAGAGNQVRQKEMELTRTDGLLLQRACACGHGSSGSCDECKKKQQQGVPLLRRATM